MNLEIEYLIHTFDIPPWIFLPFGLLLGLLGFRLHKISMFCIGFFAGLFTGLAVGQGIGNPDLGVIIGLVLGVVGGLLNLFLIRIGFFIAGAIGSYVAINLTTINLVFSDIRLGTDSVETLLWLSVICLVGGLLTMIFYRILVVIMTSMIGTFFIYIGTSSVFPAEAEIWVWTLYVALFIVFFIVQILTVKNEPDPLTKRKKAKASRW